MQGNVPNGGVNGLIKARIGDLNTHGCLHCGSLPLSGDNNPDEMGILTSNFVGGLVCQGICEYS